MGQVAGVRYHSYNSFLKINQFITIADVSFFPHKCTEYVQQGYVKVKNKVNMDCPGKLRLAFFMMSMHLDNLNFEL